MSVRCIFPKSSHIYIIYIRNEYVDCNTVILWLKMNSDCLTWEKFNGNLFELDDDIYLCLCYIVPSGSSREIDITIFDTILEDILHIEAITNDKYHLIICGDLGPVVQN